MVDPHISKGRPTSSSHHLGGGKHAPPLIASKKLHCCCVCQVVIHEALMLLRDAPTAAGETDSATASDTLRRFINAVFGTKFLAKPPYIQIA